ncbi:M56 family metallopeptidase [Mucilaginibacter sp.]|uniref:M56 family metallopeptidase n=1 Tax=Mucilaginibacter sp. TaxID=1882438 RepID=UPI00263975DD|nr:M56 family metallopeptidase [Mucilaginibacter sp.]MDB4924672.1 hypothetical protein [Mucilaginibacter sp.]
MENLFYNISQVLGITIIHSVWQGLVIYIALRLFVLAFPATSSAVKYRVAYSALAITLGWFIVTLFKELGNYNWLSTTALQISPLTLPAIMHEVSAPANRFYFTISNYMPYLTMLYVVGLVFNTLRLTLAWNSIYRIRQNISDAGFENTIKRLSAKLDVKNNVQAAFSEWVDVPCITGFIKPIILLPLSITCYLSTDEIEAILLHELAHIKRNDYLLNFIQQVMSILLFFNPFARLVNKIINEERENCCDDVVVHVTGSPFIYAQALLKLEENKHHQWQLALAATRKKYELLNRIERIMKTKTQTVNIRPVLITVLALTCSISSIAWLNPEIKNGKVIIKNAPAIKMIKAAISAPPAVAAPALPAAPLKHKRSLSIKYYNDSTRFNRLNDTTIKNKKYKIVIEDEKGNKKEYNSVNELPVEDRNDFLGNTVDLKMAMDDSARFALKKLYTSDQWKKQAELMKKQGLLMAKKFNSPEWKQKQKVLVEKSMAMAKMVNSKQFKKQQELVALQGEKMAKQFNSPEWKKHIEEMQKSGEDMAKFYDSPEWKKQIEDIQKSGEDMGKYYDSPEWKKQIEDIQKSGEDMGKYFDSPEWKKKMAEIKIKEPVYNPKIKYAPIPKKYLKIKQFKKIKKIDGKEVIEAPVPPAPVPEVPEKPEAPEKPERSPL